MPRVSSYDTLATPPAATDKILVLDVSDTTQSAEGTIKVLEASTVGLTPKRYVALLTQSGTSAPVATVLENTLGGTVVWGYTSSGVYTATLVGAFTSAKTMAQANLGSGGYTGVLWTRTSDDVLTVQVSGGNGTITNAFFEIRVYP